MGQPVLVDMQAIKSYKQLALAALDQNSPEILFEALSQSNYSKHRPDEGFIEISNRLLDLQDNTLLKKHLAELLGLMAMQNHIFESEKTVLANESVAFKFLELASALPNRETLAEVVAQATQLVLNSNSEELNWLRDRCFAAMYQQCAEIIIWIYGSAPYTLQISLRLTDKILHWTLSGLKLISLKSTTINY